MPFTTFEFTVPALARGLDVLQSYLDMVRTEVEAGRLDEATIFKTRLAPDMFSLGQQIRTACDNAKNGPARLTGRNAPVFDDTETNVADYINRVTRTRDYLHTFRPADFEGSECRLIDQSFRGAEYSMTGGDYLRAVLLPNFYFHAAVIHAMLRHKGLQIGKLHFLGNVPQTDAKPGEQGNCNVPAGHSMRFLTAAEATAWIRAHGMSEESDTNDPQAPYFQFAPQPIDLNLRDLICSLIEDFGPFTGGLLRITDWIWDNEYATDPTIPYREAQGETRSLLEVPGFLFAANGAEAAADLLALMVEHRWTALFYFDSRAAILQLCEGDRIDVYSATSELEQQVRYRLIESGADITMP